MFHFRVTWFLLMLYYGSVTNDEGPTRIQFTVPENLPLGTAIGDIGEQLAMLSNKVTSPISFSILRQDYFNPDLFMIYDGQLFATGSLDYEQQTLHSIIVGVRYKGEVTQKMIVVTIFLTDVNDNKPNLTINTLSGSDVVEVAGGTPPGNFVLHASVWDPDSGAAGNIECELEGGDSDLFILKQLYQSEYIISTTTSLDKNIREDYQVTITCKDFGTPQLVSQKTVPVKVV